VHWGSAELFLRSSEKNIKLKARPSEKNIKRKKKTTLGKTPSSNPSELQDRSLF